MSEHQGADKFSVDITMPSEIFDAQNSPPFWKMLNPSMITREEYQCHQTRITCDENHLMVISCAIPLPGDSIPRHISFYCERCDRYRHVEVVQKHDQPKSLTVAEGPHDVVTLTTRHGTNRRSLFGHRGVTGVSECEDA